MKTALFGALCLAAATLSLCAATHAVSLFTIERNKNANVVHYDAQLTDTGAFDPEAPVVAYWIMLSEDGRRETLNFVERHKAYGFDLTPDSATNGYTMTIVAYKDRKISIKKEDGKVWAEITIAGRPALFEKMYINSTEGLVVPTINYIELFGKDLETGAPLHEKITPK